MGTTVGEFIRIEAGVRAPTKEWSSKENLLLLEALLSYGDNWNQVGSENLVLLILNRRLVVVNKYLTL